MDSADADPIVILEDGDAAEPPPPLDAHAQRYLIAQGITDAATWSAFRLNEIGEDVLMRWGFTGHRRLHADHGISIPMWLPTDPQAIVGIVRQNVAQNQHLYITRPPAGIAGPVSLVDASRVVLVAAPLLALRLHQAGVAGVALVEDPSVLPPLRDWLAGRELVIAAHKPVAVAAIQAELGPLGTAIPSVLMATVAHRLSASVCAWLGVTSLPAPAPAQPITPQLLLALHDYAIGRVASGEAMDALRALEADIADLVSAYRIGFLCSDYRAVLDRAARRSLGGMALGASIVLPAYDAAGAIVDLLAVQARDGGRSSDGMYAKPQGLLAPAIVTSHPELIITDTFHWLARLFQQGHRNVLLLRGPVDAQQNASRLASMGVCQVVLRVRRLRDDMAAALRAAGIAVQVDPNSVLAAGDGPETRFSPVIPAIPAQPSPATTVPEPPTPLAPPAQPVPAPPATDALVFIEADRQAGVVIYHAGLVRYAVEWRDDGDSRRHIVIRAHSQTAQDRCDLAIEVQRQRFAGNAARRLNVPAATIASHLSALLPLLQAQDDAQDRTQPSAVSADDRAIANQFLDSPDLLARIGHDLAALGWIGDERTTKLLYLCALSRLLPHPVWAVHRAGAGAAPWLGLGCIAALTPPEDVVVFHQLTASALTQRETTSLRHRLVLLDQAETLRPAAALALRILYERGGVGWSTAAAAAAGGGAGASMLGDLRGPVAVVAAAAGDLDPRCRDGFLRIQVNESPAHTAQWLASQRQHLGGRAPASPAAARAIIARHQAAQRVMERLPVVLPFVDRIVFPSQSVRHRDEHRWLLALIATSALLHQRQRPRAADGSIIASEADVHAVVDLTTGILGVATHGISAQARHLLGMLCQRHVAHFTMADLAGWCPDWTRYTFRAALHDLLDFGYLVSPRTSSRGKLRTFSLAMRGRAAGAAGERTSAIHLRPVGADADVADLAVGELAKRGETDIANCTPEAASG